MPRRTSTHITRPGLAVALAVLGSLAATARAQVIRSPLEAPDVYDFAPPLDVEPRYRHDPENPRLILNPDFFCTRCAREGRIPFESRDEMKDVLETEVVFPHPVDGRSSRRHGAYRLLERDAGEVLDVLMGEMKADNPCFIEDRMFRLYTDLEKFSTRKVAYPRREEELRLLADIFPDLSEKTVVLDPHRRAHLYLIRAHRVLRDFQHIVDYDPEADYLAYLGPYLGVAGKFEIFIFPSQRLTGGFMQRFLGHSNELDGRCWHTLQDDSMVAIMHGENIPDVWLHNTFTYRLSYLFAQAFRQYAYDLPAWFLLGFAHLMARRERTDYNTFTFGEGRIPDSFWGTQRWKPAVRKMVEKGDLRPLVELAQFTQPNDLRPEERGIAWSLVSYQMQLDQKKLGRFLHVLKEKQPGESIYNLQRRAFQQVYGQSMIEFFEAWKKWVGETYPRH